MDGKDAENVQCYCPRCNQRFEEYLSPEQQQGERLADGRLLRLHLACVVQAIHDEGRKTRK